MTSAPVYCLTMYMETVLLLHAQPYKQAGDVHMINNHRPLLTHRFSVSSNV